MRKLLMRIFVVVLAFLVIAGNASAAVIFSDDFDSCTVGCNAIEIGLPPNSPDVGAWGQWYGVDSDTIGGVTHYAGEISSPGRGGTGKSFKMWRAGTGWFGNGAYIGALVPGHWEPQRRLFMRWFMKIPVAFDAYNAYNMKFFRIISDGNPDVAYIQVNAYSSGWTRDVAQFQISDNFIHPWQSGWPWETLLGNSEVKTKMWDGNWHSHEFEFDLDGNTLRYWVDDILQYENTNWIWNIQGGITWINHFNLGNQIDGGYWQTGWQAMEMDDLVISTTAIGSGGGTTSDTTPNQFSFIDNTGLPISTLSYSDPITVTGIDTAVSTTASTTGCTYQVNGTGSWLTTGSVVLNNTVKLRTTSSSSYLTATSCLLNIGGVTDTWYATTMSNPVPEPSILIHIKRD
jgi:hypothetical protein